MITKKPAFHPDYPLQVESIKMRIGLHTGNVIAGNIGSEEMLQYTTIGDTVNVAARLEQANKEFNTDISFSSDIYNTLCCLTSPEGSSRGTF